LRLAAALALAGFALVSCRTVPSVRPTAAAELRPVETTDGSAASWSPAHRLQWDDYRARPPADRDEAAVTATSLNWGFSCVDDEFTFEIVATFFPDRSWVNPMVFVQQGAAQRTLRHEQTHFDLTEVYARLARQFFRQLRRPCDRSEAELTALGGRFVRQEFDAQRRYDRETANGRDGPAQSRWEREVRERLEALADFVR
jgi:hypothetical protein